MCTCFMHVPVYACLLICKYMQAFICMCARMYIHVCVYAYVYAHIPACLFVSCMFIYLEHDCLEGSSCARSIPVSFIPEQSGC